MIHPLRNTKWLTSVKCPLPNQSCSVSRSQYLRQMCTVVSSQDHQHSFSISGLICSSDLFHIPASKIERLGSSKRPRLVMQFLQESNFSESQVKSIVSRYPLILLSHPEKTLKPKIEYLWSLGISQAEIVRLVFMEPKVLTRSLKGYMIPLHNILRSVVGSDENAAKVIKSYPYLFRTSVRKALELNVATLRDAGVPDSRISTMILNRARVITPRPERFKEAVEVIRSMGINPADYKFGNAVTAFGCCSRSTWTRKFDLYRSYGATVDEIIAGFKTQPMIMMLKEENVRDKMDFFVKKLCWSPSKIMKRPHFLLLSLEVRIIPRLSMSHVLVSRGLINKISSVQFFLKIAEKKFVQKYVAPFQDKVPLLSGANQGKFKIDDWSSIDINSVFKVNEYASDK